MKAIIEDTRQKQDKHLNLVWPDNLFVKRAKLVVGDYAAPPSISVDTKQDLGEIAKNLCGSVQEKRRFLRECKLAKELGCRLIILIEDGSIKSTEDLMHMDVQLRHGPITVPGYQLVSAMYVMRSRYGVEFRFCDPKDTSKIIMQLLEGKENE